MVYKFKENTRLALDPQVVGECLHELLEKNGGELNARLVLESAKSEDSPLHSSFEWDDKRAAELHRLTHAGYIIRNVEVVYTDGARSELVQAFIRNPEEKGTAVYMTVARVMTTGPMREKYLDNLRREAVHCKTRLAKFEEFSQVVIAIDSVLQKVA